MLACGATSPPQGLDSRHLLSLLAGMIVPLSHMNTVGSDAVAAGGHYRIENAEFRHCGQKGRLGRYCTHFHATGDNPPPHSYIKSNSFHHSFQRAVTVHATDHALVQNNVAYNVLGHTYFLEDGTERFNVFDANIAIFTQKLTVMLISDTKPGGFWTQNPQNTWINNVATGSESFGMWFELLDSTTRLDTIRFHNNTCHHNNEIGFRIYPRYAPANSQIFTNNSFYRNGVFGFFARDVGLVQMAGTTFARNSVDVLWRLYDVTGERAGLLSDGNIRGCVFWGHNGTRSSLAIHGPGTEYWMVNGAVFIDYATDGAIAGCAECCSPKKPRQGAVTLRLQQLRWINSGARTLWTCPYKSIFLDLDGTLTGHVGGSALPYYPFNAVDNRCVREASGAFDQGHANGGIVCDGSVRVRRLAIRDPLPSQLHGHPLRIAQTSAAFDTFHVNWTLATTQDGQWYDNATTGINYRQCATEFNGWAVPLVTNVDYLVGHDDTVDFQSLDVHWGARYYLHANHSLPLVDDEATLLRWPYRDYRYRYHVVDDVRGERPWYDRNSGILNFTRHDAFGAGYIQRRDESLDTTGCCGEWAVAVNPWNGTSNASGLDGADGFHVEARQCAPGMCGLPPVTNGSYQVLRWSNNATWSFLAGVSVYSPDAVRTGAKPEEQQVIEIPAGVHVILDEDPPVLSKLVVAGRLTYDGQDRCVCECLHMVVCIWMHVHVGVYLVECTRCSCTHLIVFSSCVHSVVVARNFVKSCRSGGVCRD